MTVAVRMSVAKRQSPPPRGGFGWGNVNIRALKKEAKNRLLFSALLGTRTLDPLIKSQLLYQLS